MEEAKDRFAELREQAGNIRVEAIEANQALIAKLTEVWNELNGLAAGLPEARKLREQIAGDIARLEKLDLAFETEWLAEARRARP
jgi:SepF-like predicted cell division protein (DUF552 family)